MIYYIVFYNIFLCYYHFDFVSHCKHASHFIPRYNILVVGQTTIVPAVVPSKFYNTVVCICKVQQYTTNNDGE